MKYSNQMRINDSELCAIYKILCKQRACYIDHFAEDGSPVYVYTKTNEIYLNLFYKFQRELTKRGLLNA